eukprot:105564-Pleurochrysis_carterae.AAC.1
MRHPVEPIHCGLQSEVEARHRSVCGPPRVRTPDHAHRHRRHYARHPPVCCMQIVSRKFHAPLALLPSQLVHRRCTHSGWGICPHTSDPY